MRDREKRTVRDLRRTNRSAVLRKLYFDGPLSRQELAPATGLSSGSISNVVAELTADGLLEEAGSVGSDGGRPRTLLRVARRSAYLIGADVGETRVRVELFDLALTELARSERPLAADGYDVDRVVAHIRDALADVLRDTDVPPDRLLGVGIGVPGIVDQSSPRGAVVHGQTVGWDAVPLSSLLRSAEVLPAEVPLFVDNGAKTLGQAEMWFGAGRGARHAVIALIGSGVGACVITDGRLYGGAHSSAGEWGHTTMRVRGRRCRCGALGCLEAYVGAESVLERWAETGGSPQPSDEEAALAALLTAADAGEDKAVALLEETAEYLGAGIADLVNLFNPERIIISGWAGLMLGRHALPTVREAASSYALSHPLERTTIELGRLGPDAVTVGAATLPLADFLARGGRTPEPAPVVP